MNYRGYTFDYAVAREVDITSHFCQAKRCRWVLGDPAQPSLPTQRARKLASFDKRDNWKKRSSTGGLVSRSTSITNPFAKASRVPADIFTVSSEESTTHSYSDLLNSLVCGLTLPVAQTWPHPGFFTLIPS